MNIFNKSVKFWINDFLKLGFHHILTVNSLGTILGLASQLFVVWLLTAEEIGQIRIMQSFLSYAVLIGGLGFNSSTLKLCSENRPDGEIVYLYKKALLYSAGLSIITLLGFIVLNHFDLLIQNKKFENLLSLFLLSVFPLVINSIDSYYLQSRREFKKLSQIQLISRFISVILIIALTYFKGIYGFIIANVIGNFLTFSLLFVTVNKINCKIQLIKINNTLGLHMKYSGFAFLSNITYQASLYFDMVLLNYLVKNDPKAIGSYGVATLIVSFFSIVTSSVQQVLIPVFSGASSSVSEWEKIYKKYNKIYLYGISFLGLIGIMLLPFLLTQIFGTKFERIGLFFSFLCLSWILRSFYSLKSSALFGLGKLKVIFILSLILVFIGLPLNYLMISKYGVIGAAIANLSTSLVGFLIYDKSFSNILKREVSSLMPLDKS